MQPNLTHDLGGVGLPNWKLESTLGLYWRQSDRDAVYRNGGAVLRAATESRQSRARHIATQFEAVATWAPVRGFDLRLGYALFEPGRFIEETGPASTVHFWTAEARLWF